MTPRTIRHACFTPLSVALVMFLTASDLRAAPTGDANTIVLKDFHFSPMSLTVPAGMTVVWKNLDGEPHTVVSDTGVFRSGGLDQNDSFTFQFDRPGTYRFFCSIHPSMMGTITVNKQN
jgi:plastocyanin